MSSRRVQYDAFCFATKDAEGLAISCRRDDTYETSGASILLNISQLSNQPGIVVLVIGITVGQAWLSSSVARRMHAWCTSKRVDLQTRIISDDDLLRRILAVIFGLLTRVRFEGLAVLHRQRQRRKPRQWGDLNTVYSCCSGKITKFTGI